MPKRKSGSKIKSGGAITKSTNNNVKRTTDNNKNQRNLQLGGVAGFIAVATALYGIVSAVTAVSTSIATSIATSLSMHQTCYRESKRALPLN